MRKLLPALLALLLVFSMSVQSTFAAVSFKDVDTGYWASKVIEQYSKQGIINGFEDGTFRPEAPVTRAQAAVMLARALELDVENAKAVSYKDVDAKHGAYKAIAAVTNAGIMSGFEGKFNPQKPLTRGQMATILAGAFDLVGEGKANFKDVTKKHANYAAIDALFAHAVTTGYDDQTFKPNKPTTRAHFVVFLSRILDKAPAEKAEIVNVLEEVYANEFELDTYTFEGSMNLGLLFPDMGELDAETAMMFETLKDINIDMNGIYKKDPMQFEIEMAIHLKGETNQTLRMPMIMTEEKLWMKYPETELMPLPEEVKGKFIEMDFAALGAEAGQTMDFETQMNLSKELTSVMIEKLGAEFYKEVPVSSVQAPAGMDVQKVVKFELTNDDLKPFLEVVVNDLLPKFTEMMDTPAYQEALGMTGQDAEMMEGFDLASIITMLGQFITINDFEQYMFITPDKYIGYDKMNLDLGINVMGESFGLRLSYDLTKANVNEAVNFKMAIPTGSEVVTYERLMELQTEMFEEMYGDEMYDEAYTEEVTTEE